MALRSMPRSPASPSCFPARRRALGLNRTARLVASATLIAAVGWVMGAVTVGCAGRADRSSVIERRTTAALHLSFAQAKARRGQFTRTHAREGSLLGTFTAPEPSATDTVLGQLLTNVTRENSAHDQDTFCPHGMASVDGLYCIDRFEAIHTLEREPDLARSGDRTLHETREAPHGHDRLAGRMAGSENARDFVGTRGSRDRKRETGTLVGPADGASAYG